MNRTLKKLLEVTWLKWLWTMRPELTFACIALFLFFIAAPILRWLDPTAAWLDGGWLAFVVTGVVAVSAAIILFWICIRMMFPNVDGWFDGDNPLFSFVKDFRDASPAVRLGFFVAIFYVVVRGACEVVAAAF